MPGSYMADRSTPNNHPKALKGGAVKKDILKLARTKIFTIIVFIMLYFFALAGENNF